MSNFKPDYSIGLIYCSTDQIFPTKSIQRIDPSRKGFWVVLFRDGKLVKKREVDDSVIRTEFPELFQREAIA